MIIIAVDYGDVRTGLAVCDKNEILASPVAVITESDRERLIEKIIDYARERQAEAFVVGLPKNMDGTEGFRAEATYAFTDDLKKIYGGEIIHWDERLSTVSAARVLNETNTRGKNRKKVLDTVAACFILENYLNHSRM